MVLPFPGLAIVTTVLGNVSKVYLNTCEIDVIIRATTVMVVLRVSFVYFRAFYLYYITFNIPFVTVIEKYSTFITVSVVH